MIYVRSLLRPKYGGYFQFRLAQSPSGKASADAESPIRAPRPHPRGSRGRSPIMHRGRVPSFIIWAILSFVNFLRSIIPPIRIRRVRYFLVTRDPGVVRPVAALFIGALGGCLGMSGQNLGFGLFSLYLSRFAFRGLSFPPTLLFRLCPPFILMVCGNPYEALCYQYDPRGRTL